MITVTLKCRFCGNIHFVDVNPSDYFDWQGGKLAQRAFPYLSPSQREQLISEMCQSCQNKIFGEEVI